MRRLALLPLLLVTVAALASCVPTEDAADTPGATSPTTSPSPSATSGATGGPTAAPTAEPGATPVGFGCADVVTLQEMFDYNSIYSETPYSPDAGSLASTAVEMGGIACRWVNTSSGVTIDFSFAQPAPAQLDEFSGAPAFQAAGGAGQAQTVVDGYWVSIVSADLVSEQDAGPLLEIATNSL